MHISCDNVAVDLDQVETIAKEMPIVVMNYAKSSEREATIHLDPETTYTVSVPQYNVELKYIGLEDRSVSVQADDGLQEVVSLSEHIDRSIMEYVRNMGAPEGAKHLPVGDLVWAEGHDNCVRYVVKHVFHDVDTSPFLHLYNYLKGFGRINSCGCNMEIAIAVQDSSNSECYYAHTVECFPGPFEWTDEDESRLQDYCRRMESLSGDLLR